MQTGSCENETPESGLVVKDYHKRFVKAAKDQLDPRTFAKLHHFAKSSAGGAAPRRAKEPVAKSAWASTLTDMWAATVRAFTGVDYVRKDAAPCSPVGGVGGGTPAPHTNVPIGEIRPRKRKKGKTVPPQESILKFATIGRAVATADGVEDTGFAVQLDAGGKRVPGFLGFGVEGDDQWTMPDDLALGIPLEDGCADVLYVSKSALLSHGPGLLEEAQRVAKPDARVYMEDGVQEILKGGEREERRPARTGNGRAQGDALDVISKVQKSKPGQEDLPLSERIERITEERRDLVLKALSQPFPIMGINAHEQIMYGPVLVPGEVHVGSKDYMTPEDIRYTAHGYMEKGRLIGGEHASAIDACVLESFIAPCDLHFDGANSPYGAQDIPAGSWVAAVKVRDPDEWQKVLTGEYTGFSTGGWGSRGAWEDDA